MTRPPLTLPAYTPSSWELILPGYPVIKNSFRSVSYPELLGSLPSDARWRLSFENVTNQEALALLLPWRASGCGLWPLTELPEELAGGVDDENFRKRLLNVIWTIESEPTKEPVKNGRHNVRINLIHELTFDSTYSEPVEPGCEGMVIIGPDAISETAGIIYFHDNEEDYFELYGEPQETPPDTTSDPIYTYLNYNGSVGQPTVSFGSWFEGQSLDSECVQSFPDSLSTCITGTISAPLALAIEPETDEWGLVQTEITSWFSSSESSTPPVLMGGASAYGPITILFDQDVAAIGLKASLFLGEAPITLKAYDESGEFLGEVESDTITSTEFTYIGMATCDGTDKIRGVQIIGDNGYVIDSVQFAREEEVTLP